MQGWTCEQNICDHGHYGACCSKRDRNDTGSTKIAFSSSQDVFFKKRALPGTSEKEPAGLGPKNAWTPIMVLVYCVRRALVSWRAAADEAEEADGACFCQCAGNFLLLTQTGTNRSCQ